MDLDTGKVYTTKGFHDINQLPKEVLAKHYKRANELVLEDGFLTPEGKFLNREEVKSYTGSIYKQNEMNK
jgi:hypothetical protein